MIQKIYSASNECEKRQNTARFDAKGKTTLPNAENAKENDFIGVFRDIYNKAQEQKGKTR